MLMMTTTTQRFLDLAAAAPACHDEDLVLLLREASNLYQQGFEDLCHTVAARFAGLSSGDPTAATTAAGMPCDVSQDRDELVLLLAPAESAVEAQPTVTLSTTTLLGIKPTRGTSPIHFFSSQVRRKNDRTSVSSRSVNQRKTRAASSGWLWQPHVNAPSLWQEFSDLWRSLGSYGW
ncbi:hypothetical protein ACFZAR_41380 [Streptomyces sp. NPDC008222]|uniref:hypothetical protein n=1 Tax=Streptomyces sp. NPDC008222 TaxID=3364820 RepID=UPI0036EF69AD